ncbi:CocE/NonD family hydrolase [Microbacterium elymi]|uniref:CocE/NonD family hydrolase n=1 Tax=Microbacterium elymi TaxID=2909587 RepID=A0ABY5NM50_9MICO|nr:CocE/NonD family hydrolase [Microbacterium elymi]UUT36194.1 CocE/NonD family hydrolase [Microbacterium elymi]
MAAYRVSGLRIPLRDGITLGADLYTPAGESKGLLLTRGPYGRGRMIARRMAGPWAAQGWTVLFVSSRGTADSGGQFDPMRTEQADGQDVAAWMREQDWYPGRFATVGGSYLGYTQWAMLADPPADLVAAVVLMGPHDFSRHAWGTGTFTLDLFGWTEQTVVLGGRGILRTILGMITANRRLRPVLQATPTVDAAVAHFGDAAPWLRDRLVRDDLADPYWAPMQHTEALERTDIPVLILGGWQDIFLRQSIQQYRRLARAGRRDGPDGRPVDPPRPDRRRRQGHDRRDPRLAGCARGRDPGTGADGAGPGVRQGDGCLGRAGRLARGIHHPDAALRRRGARRGAGHSARTPVRVRPGRSDADCRRQHHQRRGIRRGRPARRPRRHAGLLHRRAGRGCRGARGADRRARARRRAPRRRPVRADQRRGPPRPIAQRRRGLRAACAGMRTARCGSSCSTPRTRSGRATASGSSWPADRSRSSLAAPARARIR